MSLTPPINVSAGTPEAAWRDWQELAALPHMDWGEPRSLIVVAPHPDDEVLGCGATLAALRKIGFQITVLAVTDGEGSHPDHPELKAELARRRPAETSHALEILGLGDVKVRRLCIPDGGVEANVQQLVEAITDASEPGGIVLAPWHLDGHPDHEGCSAAAATAAERGKSQLVQYPVWLWNWARPGDPLVAWEQLRLTRLSQSQVAAKAAAIAAFATQLEPIGGPPILPINVLEHHLRPFEAVFVDLKRAPGRT